MIKLKTNEQLDVMRQSCHIADRALHLAGEMIEPGLSLIAIDNGIKKYITEAGAVPSFYNYNSFPANACISVNSEVIHGIPDNRKLLQGDIVSIDVGAYYKGYHGDCANTFAVGEISSEAKRLIEVTKKSFFDGLAAIKSGGRVGDISSAVQTTVEQAGYSVVKEFVGHGVGRNLHEEPEVPNYGVAGRGPRLYSGMTIAIEPMVCVGSSKVKCLDNGWTVVTCDNSLSAHYENTVAITENGPEILTRV